MPNWSQILEEIQVENPLRALEHKRKHYLQEISNITGRNVITYYSGWLKNPAAPNTLINDADTNAFMTMIHGMDRTKGLDLILHTPGGDIAATESIVNYLKRMFNNDIRAIVPQISMSAGTLVALSCKEIVMGEQSSLGPVDPQQGGIACQAALEEFYSAVKEVSVNEHALGLWQPIIAKLNPTFLTSCRHAITWTKNLMDKWVKESNPKIDIDKVKDKFLNHNNSHAHNRHLSKHDCKYVGLNIRDLEANQNLQDAVLSLHHCYMILFDKANISKILENHNGTCYACQYNPQKQ